MNIRDIMPFLAVVLVLVGVVAAAGMAVYIILRLRAGERVGFPLGLLFRVYLYLISIISIVLMASGASALAQAGVAAVLGKEFSYIPSYVATAPPQQKPDVSYQGPSQAELEAQKRQGLDRAMKEGLLNGISLLLVGAVAWGLHTWGRRRLETKEERDGMLHRGYLILLLVVFSVMTLVTLPSAIYDTLRYYILPPLDEFSNSAHPGGRLATAMVSFPVWVYYLNIALQLVRRQSEQGAGAAAGKGAAK